MDGWMEEVEEPVPVVPNVGITACMPGIWAHTVSKVL